MTEEALILSRLCEKVSDDYDMYMKLKLNEEEFSTSLYNFYKRVKALKSRYKIEAEVSELFSYFNSIQTQLRDIRKAEAGSRNEEARGLREDLGSNFNLAIEDISKIYNIAQTIERQFDRSGSISVVKDLDLDHYSKIEDITLEHTSEVVNCALIIDMFEPDKISTSSIQLRDLLKSNNRSIFDIPNDFFLAGNDATYRRIQVALSKIFRQPNNYGLVFFFFRGYWYTESLEETYLGSVDIDVRDPFVSGLSLKMLKEIVSNSSNRSKTVIMILDCCNGNSFKDMETTFRDSILVFSDESEGTTNRIIIGSCEHANNKVNGNNAEARYHWGDITISIINALKGAATNEFGIITMSQIYTTMSQIYNSTVDSRPTAFFFPTTSEEVQAVDILVTQDYEDKTKTVIQNIYETCQKCRTGKYESKFLLFVQDAIIKLKKLRELEQKNTIIENFIGGSEAIINIYLTNLGDDISSWLGGNKYYVQITRANPGLYAELEGLAKSLSSQISGLNSTSLSTFDLLTQLRYGLISLDNFIDKTKLTKGSRTTTPPFTPPFRRPTGQGSLGG
jgi:hypothetical protein